MNDQKQKTIIQIHVDRLIDKMENLYKNQMNPDLKKSTKEILLKLASSNLKGQEQELIALLDNTYNLLIQRVKIGFTFDVTPSNPNTIMHYLTKINAKTVNIVNQLNPKQNHLIIGENYYALQNLIAAGYTSKIDIIYIDPPYNTKKMQSYKDKFKRNGWLSMLKERLELAKELLSGNGVIFVSIDDSEQAYLKVLMDEIFSESNFIGTLIHQKKSGGGQATKYYKGHDYIHVYALGNNFSLYVKDRKKFKYIVKNNQKIFYDSDVIRRVHGKYSNNTHRNVYYEDIRDVFTKSKCDEIDKAIMNNKYILVKDVQNKHFICKWWKESSTKYKFLYSILKSDKKSNIDLWTSTANKNINQIIPNCFFVNSKAVDLLKLLINSTKKNNAVVLDFFAGSGTTGHAVMDLNREDNGNRKFILCTNSENDIDKVCYERLHRVMTGKGTKGEVSFPWQKNNQSYSSELLNYYEIRNQDCSLNRQSTLQENSTQNLLDEINQAYKSLFGESYKKLTLKNWFSELYNLLLNSEAEQK